MEMDYTCTLSSKSLKRAKDELNEIPSDRLSSVQKLREWIVSQDNMVCRTDTDFLLRFLRTAKFSQLRAREIIQGLLTLKLELPQHLHNYNPLEKHVQYYLKGGLFVPLPGYLENGTKVIIYRFCKVAPKVITKEYKDALVKCWYLIMWYLLKDENVQVCGCNFIFDYTDATMKAITMYSLSEVKEIMRFQNNVAGRFRGWWGYNEGTLIDAFMLLFKPFMKKKMLDRITLFGSNLEKMYRSVPMSMLPDEYLPDDYTGPRIGTLDQLTETFWKDISSEDVIDYLMYESDPKWKILKKVKISDVDAPLASFRKINLD